MMGHSTVKCDARNHSIRYSSTVTAQLTGSRQWKRQARLVRLAIFACTVSYSSVSQYRSAGQSLQFKFYLAVPSTDAADGCLDR